MTAGPESVSGVGNLALRLAAALFLSAACLFALIAVGITQFEIVTVNGASRYALPGVSGRSLDPMAVRVLAICACATGLLGTAVWVLGRGRAITWRPAFGAGRRPYMVLGAGLFLLIAALIVRFGL